MRAITIPDYADPAAKVLLQRLERLERRCGESIRNVRGARQNLRIAVRKLVSDLRAAGASDGDIRRLVTYVVSRYVEQCGPGRISLVDRTSESAKVLPYALSYVE